MEFNYDLNFFSDGQKTRDALLSVDTYISPGFKLGPDDSEPVGAWVLFEKI